jgi:hypothetical protein
VGRNSFSRREESGVRREKCLLHLSWHQKHFSLLTPPSSLLEKEFHPTELLKTRNKQDKCLEILEEFKNENLLAANSRVLRVHLLASEHQHVTTKTSKVCNKISPKVLP